jgi:hypothetical protein
MRQQRKQRLANALMGPHGRLPRRLRLGFFAAGLVLLGVSRVGIDDDAVQVLVFLALMGSIAPLHRRFARSDDYSDALRERDVPWRVFLTSMAFALLWGALVFVAVPESLGGLFALWLILWPWGEVLMALADRDLRTNGPDGWRRRRPVRDSGLAGLVAAALITAIGLADGFSVGEAILTGGIAGAFAVLFLGTLAWLLRHAPVSER